MTNLGTMLMKIGRRSILKSSETMVSAVRRIKQMEILIKIWLIKWATPSKMILKILINWIKKVCIKEKRALLKNHWILDKYLKMSRICKTNKKRLDKKPWIYQINSMKN